MVVLSDSFPYWRCRMLARAQFCDSGAAQELVDSLHLCNSSQEEISERMSDCLYNSKGKYCNLRYDLKLLNETSLVCESSNSTCSGECINMLIQIREDLGCCINHGLNFTSKTDIFGSSVEIFGTTFDNSLWERCNVSVPHADGCSSTVKHPSEDMHIDPSCDGLTPSKVTHSSLCLRDFRVPLRTKLMSTSGCEDYDKEELPSCEVNQAGEYCETFDTHMLESRAMNATQNCENGTTCGPSCREILKNILTVEGCCINARDEDVSRKHKWLDNELWWRCNLTAPNSCKEKLEEKCNSPISEFCQGRSNGAAGTFYKKASILVKTASVAAILLLAALLE